jgi:hypothetical protein
MTAHIWGAHAARVLAMAARHRELSSVSPYLPEYQEDRFGEAAETSTRAACAPQNAVDASSLFIK